MAVIYDYDRSTMAPAILRMERDCTVALASVRDALRLLRASPRTAEDQGSIGPREAMKDLAKVEKVLEDIVGSDAPFLWHRINPERSR
jgi:hypothetical protein